MTYSQKVMEHFQDPHNLGGMESPDSVGEIGNPQCGDIMKLYLKISKNPEDIMKSKITDVSFETLGCGAAIATSSMVTDLAKGKTLEEALRVKRDNVAEELEGLPPVKMHCSNLAADALHKAVNAYLEKNKG